ncbi:MAG: indolepyruvate ferredoxin oxidoreductase, partial [Bacteroidales bacterium]|nr:indolepyruvate ferredoxin oxidoreductase [Bacteroidales bacterium]
PVTIMILDNETTGMTGGQESSAWGKLEQICEGVGVEKEHIRVLKPLRRNHDEMVKVIAEELAYNGVSVIIPRRECIQTIGKFVRSAEKK